MVEQVKPTSAEMSNRSPIEMQQDFVSAVESERQGSEQWWNGVAAAVNGISFHMSFNWLEGKFCPIEGFYNENKEPGARTSVLQNQLLPHLRDTNPFAAESLEKILDVFGRYAGNSDITSGYHDDTNAVQVALSALITEVPELHERRLNHLQEWMDNKLPHFPMKKGFEFNA
jgi:hypothetical protein